MLSSTVTFDDTFALMQQMPANLFPVPLYQRPLLFLDRFLCSILFMGLVCLFCCSAHSCCRRCRRIPANAINATVFKHGRFFIFFGSGVTPIFRSISSLMALLFRELAIAQIVRTDSESYQAVNTSICFSRYFFSNTSASLKSSSLVNFILIRWTCIAIPISSAACLFSFS